MTPYAQRLLNAYFHANRSNIERGHGKLSKGTFMKQAYPIYEEYEGRNKRGRKQTQYRLVDDEDRWGRWKNEDSARRAFDKLTKGETSGKRYIKISENFFGVSHTEKRRGLTLQGLWRIDINYRYEDDNGNTVEEWRSFVGESSQYTHLEDLPYLYSIVDKPIEEHMEYWAATGSVWQDYEIIQVIVTPIQTSSLTMEYEQERGTYGTPGQGRISIDSLEVE
jgi:hypothetical protein